MTDLYIKFRLWMELFIPSIIIGLIIVFIVMKIVLRDSKERKIYQFFVEHGYKRKLLGVPSFGNGAFYGWVRESDNKVVDDRDIMGMNLKMIKEKYS